jgi:hypothetical protein
MYNLHPIVEFGTFLLGKFLRFAPLFLCKRFSFNDLHLAENLHVFAAHLQPAVFGWLNRLLTKVGELANHLQSGAWPKVADKLNRQVHATVQRIIASILKPKMPSGKPLRDQREDGPPTDPQRYFFEREWSTAPAGAAGDWPVRAEIRRPQTNISTA